MTKPKLGDKIVTFLADDAVYPVYWIVVSIVIPLAVFGLAALLGVI